MWCPLRTLFNILQGQSGSLLYPNRPELKAVYLYLRGVGPALDREDRGHGDHNHHTQVTRQGDTRPQGRRIVAVSAAVHRTIKAELAGTTCLGKLITLSDQLSHPRQLTQMVSELHQEAARTLWQTGPALAAPLSIELSKWPTGVGLSASEVPA